MAEATPIRLRFVVDDQGAAIAGFEKIITGINIATDGAATRIVAAFDRATSSIQSTLAGLSRTGVLDGLTESARTASSEYSRLAETIGKAVSQAERLNAAAAALKRESNVTGERATEPIVTSGRNSGSAEALAVDALRELIPAGAISEIRDLVGQAVREIRERNSRPETDDRQQPGQRPASPVNEIVDRAVGGRSTDSERSGLSAVASITREIDQVPLKWSTAVAAITNTEGTFRSFFARIGSSASSAFDLLTNPRLAAGIYTAQTAASYLKSGVVDPISSGLGEVISGTESGRRFQYAIASQAGGDDRAAAIDRALIQADQGQDIPLQSLRNFGQQAAFLSPLANQFSSGTPAAAADSGVQYAQLVQRLTLLDPARDQDQIVNAVREAVAGDLRGLQVRIGIDPTAIAAIAGKRSNELQNDPAALLTALERFAQTLVPDSALRREGSLLSVTAGRFAELPGLVGQRIGDDGAYDRLAGAASTAQSSLYSKISSGAWDKDFASVSDSISRALENTGSALSRFAQAVTGTSDNGAALDELAAGLARAISGVTDMTSALPSLASALGSAAHEVIATAGSFQSAASAFANGPVGRPGIAASEIGIGAYLTPLLSGFTSDQQTAVGSDGQTALGAMLAAVIPLFGKPSTGTPTGSNSSIRTIADADKLAGLSGLRDSSLFAVDSPAADAMAKVSPPAGHADALSDLLGGAQRGISAADQSRPFDQLSAKLSDLIAKLATSDSLAGSGSLSAADAAKLLSDNSTLRNSLQQEYPVARNIRAGQLERAASGVNVAALGDLAGVPADAAARLSSDAVFGTGSIADAVFAALQSGGLTVDRFQAIGLPSLPVVEQPKVLNTFVEQQTRAIEADASYGGPLTLRTSDSQLAALASRLPQSQLETEPALAALYKQSIGLADGTRDAAAKALTQPGGNTATNQLAFVIATDQVEKFAAALRDLTEKVPSMLDELAKGRPGEDAASRQREYDAGVDKFRSAGGQFTVSDNVSDTQNRYVLELAQKVESLRGLTPDPSLTAQQYIQKVNGGSNLLDSGAADERAKLAALLDQQDALIKEYTDAQKELLSTLKTDPSYAQKQQQFGTAATALGQNQQQVTSTQKQLDTTGQAVQQFGSEARGEITNGLGNALDAVITKSGQAKQAFREMGLSIIESFSQMTAKIAVGGLTNLLFGPGGGGGDGQGGGSGSGGGGGLLGDLITGFTGGGGGGSQVNAKADGGVFEGGFQAFASGGVVSHTRPMLGLVGEAGRDEGIVPLMNGSIPLGFRNGGIAALLPGGRHIPAMMDSVGYADGGVATGGIGISGLSSGNGIDSGFSPATDITAVAGSRACSGSAVFPTQQGPGETNQQGNIYIVSNQEEATRNGLRQNRDTVIDIVAQDIKRGGKTAKLLRGGATVGTR